MIHIPIEQRYDRRNQIFHSSAFAIGAAVVGVAAAGASAYVSMSAADKAAKAQGRAAKGLGNDLDEATQIYQQQQDEVARRMNQLDPTKKFQDWSLLGTEDIFETKPGKILKHKKGKNKGKPMRDASGNVLRAPSTTVLKQKGSPSATLEAIQAANQVTANTIQQLRTIDPYQEGAVQRAYSTLEQGQNLASELMQGAPESSRQAVLREVAGTGGAGFNIETAGKGMAIPSATQSNYARMLGQQDIDFRLKGAALGQSLGNTAMDWRNASAGFLQSVPQMMGISLAGRAQNIDVQRMGIDIQKQIADMNNQRYAAATGQAQTMYGARQGTIQSNLAAQQATAQGISDVGGALSSGLSSYGAARGMAQSGGSVAGYGGQQYVPATSPTGGQYYKPASGSIY
jgi:hypothetical protein